MTDSLPLSNQEMVRTTFEWGRIQSNSDWILPILVTVALLLFVRWMYRRDAVELGRPLRWLLSGLRMAVILVLLVLYLQPQWRTEREEVQNSRAVLLVDTSLPATMARDTSPPRASRSLCCRSCRLSEIPPQ